MNEDPLSIDTRGTRPAFFSDPDVDAVMTALLETMAQLWSTRDYARALEKLLIEKGILDQGEIDKLEWNSEEQLENNAARAAFFADAFRAIGAKFQGSSQRTQDIDDFDPDGDQ